MHVYVVPSVPSNQEISCKLYVLPSTVLLCVNFPLVFKEGTDQVDLDRRHQHHHNEVYDRPKVYPIKVTFLDVSVTGLERPQQRLDLHAFAQPTLHVVDGVLTEGRQRREALLNNKENKTRNYQEQGFKKKKKKSTMFVPSACQYNLPSTLCSLELLMLVLTIALKIVAI